MKDYDDITELLANLDSSILLELKPLIVMQQRVNFLIENKKNVGILQEEQSELDRYLYLERLIVLAKIRVRRSIRNNS
jgi:hypothetical protein